MKNKVLRKSRMKSVLRIALLVFLAAIIGLNIYTINASKLVGNTLPMPFGVGASVILSGSMEPELSVGDLIIVAEKEHYSEGDVIVYQDSRTAVTHRIVSITESSIVTKGDANNTEDAPITLEQIKGKVIFAVPYMGDVVYAIKTPFGTLLIIILAVLLLEFSFRIEKKKDTQEIDKIKEEIEKLKQENSDN